MKVEKGTYSSHYNKFRSSNQTNQDIAPNDDGLLKQALKKLTIRRLFKETAEGECVREI